MLTVSGRVNINELIQKARTYLKLYEDGRVPFRDLDNNNIRYMVFIKTNDQWVFVEMTD